MILRGRCSTPPTGMPVPKLAASLGASRLYSASLSNASAVERIALVDAEDETPVVHLATSWQQRW